jgi:tetratricopeptide (TPR) repeat protein
MSNNKPTKSASHEYLTSLGNLLKFLGGAVGASSLGMTIIYAMGFVIVNTSLLRYGAYELSVLGTEFLAAGISYSVLTLFVIFFGAVIVNLLAKKVAEKVAKKWEWVILVGAGLLVGAVLLLVVHLITGLFFGVQWRVKVDGAFIWGYWVALAGGIYIKWLDRRGLWQKLIAPAPKLPEIGKAVLWGILLLLVPLLGYGKFVYPSFPKSWGGGSPIYVEFVVEQEAKAMLETLGLRVSDQGLTERVTFLTESPERIFVVTQREDTLSFDPSLVKASKFYDVNYYASAEAHLASGDWYREARQWDRAIREYDAALLIEANLLDAWVGRGRAYTEKYLESVRKDPPDQQAYDSAHRDLTDAIRQAEEEKDDPTAALAHYQRGRLFFGYQEYKKAAEDVKDAIKFDPSFRREAMLADVFWENIRARDDDTFRRALHDSDSWIAKEYAELGRELENAGEMEQAVALYDLAAQIAEESAKDKESAAEYRFYRGNVLENLSRVGDASREYYTATLLMPNVTEYKYLYALLSYELDRSEKKEYREAVERNPNMTHYRYRFALLSYEDGRFERAEEECKELIGLAEKAAKEDVATISCRIVLGNVYRDNKKWNVARPEYDQAASLALESRAPSLAAEAYYHWGRLEAEAEDTEEAIALLERAVWLDQAYSEKAELEADFDILRALSGYQKAISPPIVERIESDVDKRTVIFHLQEPANDFPERVIVLTKILQLADLTPIDTGQAEKVEVSEDQLVYTFHLRQDASYNASELASALRELLKLVGKPLTQESGAVDLGSYPPFARGQSAPAVCSLYA